MKPIEPANEKLAYFQPDQMVYLVTHGDDLSDDSFDRLIQWSNGLAGDAHIFKRRVMRFPAPLQPPLPGYQPSVGPNIQSTKPPGERPLGEPNIQPEEPLGEQPPGQPITQPTVNPRSRFTLIFADVENTRDLVKLIKRLDDKRDDKREDQPDPSLTLERVSPNWLMSGSTHIPGSGGPGAWPVMAPLAPGIWPKFALPESLALGSSEDERGAGVHVAILDTAPSKHYLDAAYDKWQAHHPLIRSLLPKSGGPLHVYPATSDDFFQLADYSLMEHQYLMPDHGLFVAGIIHTIAPKATLHLYEVLNPYGVGSIETIAQGLLQVLENTDKRPLIINCSLVLNVPRDGHLDPDFPDKLRHPTILEDMVAPLRVIVDQLAQDNVIVVAAAGNDAYVNNSNPDRRRPSARYPAAFDSVIGVGASSKAFPPTPATYSNLSDDPPGSGYLTLGGEPGEKKGVLGVYISDFPLFPEGCLSRLWRILTLGLAKRPSGWAGPGHLPPNGRALTPDHIRYRPNKSGWAWWAGTSFAAPIVSGALAARWGDDLSANAASVQGALDTAATSQTVANERVILVQQ